MPAMSPTGKWLEVGDEIRNPSLVYGSEADAAEAVERVGYATEESVESGEKKNWPRMGKNF